MSNKEKLKVSLKLSDENKYLLEYLKLQVKYSVYIDYKESDDKDYVYASLWTKGRKYKQKDFLGILLSTIKVDKYKYVTVKDFLEDPYFKKNFIVWEHKPFIL